MSDADPSINTGGKPGEQVKGTGEVKVEGSRARLGKGGWRCRAGMTVSVCGPVERVRVRGVGGTLTAPKVRFKISDPVSKREVDVRIALHKKSNRVIVTASWIEDGVVKAIKAKPANVKELNEFLHKYVFKRLVNTKRGLEISTGTWRLLEGPLLGLRRSALVEDCSILDAGWLHPWNWEVLTIFMNVRL